MFASSPGCLEDRSGAGKFIVRRGGWRGSNAVTAIGCALSAGGVRLTRTSRRISTQRYSLFFTSYIFFYSHILQVVEVFWVDRATPTRRLIA